MSPNKCRYCGKGRFVRDETTDGYICQECGILCFDYGGELRWR